MSNTIKSAKLAQSIAEHLQKLILQGVLRPGEKLTAERELADRLGVSRPSLREAIEMLAEQGLLKTTKSGTVVAQFMMPLMKPLASILEDNPAVAADYFEFRRIIEAQAARFAATRANAVDKKAIKACITRMNKLHALDDAMEEAEADVDLHLLIYDAAHNVILAHLMRGISELLRGNIFYSRRQLYQDKETREALLKQHIEIADAILGCKPDAAEEAAARHISFTFEAVQSIQLENKRLQDSLMRVGRIGYLAR
ncbi:MAG: FadR/GntR family transcriptional regulator [Hyphomicrobium sp.]|jgi:GntR family transcriptional repressor for pyruvate dehydrogenase complex